MAKRTVAPKLHVLRCGPCDVRLHAGGFALAAVLQQTYWEGHVATTSVEHSLLRLTGRGYPWIRLSGRVAVLGLS